MNKRTSTMAPFLKTLSGCPAMFSLVCVLLVASTALAEMDVKGPCYGCRLFNLNQRKHPDPNQKDTKFCHYPCQCPVEELSCHAGVNVIKDGCGCCYACARQAGDLCNIRDKCDEKKGLFCDSEGRHATNTCKAAKNEGKPCRYKGIPYRDGEQFQPACSQMCTCQNGFAGCVNQCPQEDVKPSEETCHNAVLIKVKNQCCREWKCQKLEVEGSSILAGFRGLESQNLINPQWYQPPSSTTSTSPAPPAPRPPEPCHLTDTDWSPCSTTCDVGVSVKLVIDRAACTASQRQKLCFLRPCNNYTISTKTRPDGKCTPTTRSEKRVRIHYQDCVSYRKYNLKFCTDCKKNKCCWPSKSRTSEILFTCSDNTVMTYEFMRIRKCRCDRKCYVRGPRRRRKGRGKKRRGKGRRKGRGLRRSERRRNRRWRRLKDREPKHFDFSKGKQSSSKSNWRFEKPSIS